MPNAARGALRPTLTARTRVCSQLDTYLRALLAYPAIALSPLVCTFLDAVDVSSFRAQMLPRLQQLHAVEQMQVAEHGQQPPVVIPTVEEAPNGW